MKTDSSRNKEKGKNCPKKMMNDISIGEKEERKIEQKVASLADYGNNLKNKILQHLSGIVDAFIVNCCVYLTQKTVIVEIKISTSYFLFNHSSS